MNYEISASTTRLLRLCQLEAKKYSLEETTSLCLLKCATENSKELLSAFTKIGIDSSLLCDKLDQALKSYSNIKDKNDTNDTIDDKELPIFDANCTRIIKISVLESHLTKGQCDSALLLVLSILHDRGNEAKDFLQVFDITYNALFSLLNEAPHAGFAFSEENDMQDSNNDSTGGKKLSSQDKTSHETNDTPIIDNFGIDLTNIALRGGLDPVVGRENEISRVIQILCRRKKNNPIIIGEPGVGKSAIVEGLADRIAHRRVPHLLHGKRIVALDMAAIVAGTQYRGQFEERLRRLIQELKSHPEIVLFIDEIHTIIGAGSAPGSLDAANILKPALARGEVQCIGATTTNEFKKTIEKDGALDRRFQKIMLEPTTKEETLEILTRIKGHYEQHHNVTYSLEALKACVELTARYITNRALPDKAIDAMDEVGAHVHLSECSIPKEIEQKEKEIEALRAQKLKAAHDQNYEYAANLRDQIGQLSNELETITHQWQESQQAQPSVVDENAVADVVSKISGVPVTRMVSSESDRLRNMKRVLSEHIISQDNAIERVTRAITRSRIGLKGADRPIGTFLFVGPTGVGKTYLVKCLAEWMFGSKDSLIRVDMSEYGEKYSVSRLVGAPPGYVGYEEGGQLTERVRRHPYSVILLDEIEKAHPDVFNTLLQVMDEGRLTDGNGTTVDFRNTIIILTSNSGSRQLGEFGHGLGFERTEGEISNDRAEQIILKSLRKQFAPEFLNRLDDIIMFNPLTKVDAMKIAELEIGELIQRLSEKGLTLSVAENVKELIVHKGFDSQYGARSLKRSVQHLLEDALCDFMVENLDAKHFAAEVKGDKVEISKVS